MNITHSLHLILLSL